MSNRTGLYEIHRKLGARMVEFAGWEMPVEYSGVKSEHLSVRSRAGLFDISHMGEIEVRGRDAVSLCQRVTTNDVAALKDFQAQYTLLCRPDGGVIDDIIVYRFSEDNFFICVNAVNAAKDYEWINGAKDGFQVEVLDRSRDFSLIALQGPYAANTLGDAVGGEFLSLKRFHCRPFDWNGISLIIARTGYTGEDGFEIFLPWNRVETLWNELMEKGKHYGVQFCGLGARDTLRIEMGYPLYGHEIDDSTNPLEAGLGRFVKIAKGDFIGRDALIKSQNGLEKRLVGFEMKDPGIPRQGYGIFGNGAALGAVTSGTLSPSLQKSVGMGYIKDGKEFQDGEIEIEIRGTRRKAKIVPVPFFRKKR